ncbi:flagellar biosynthesis protein FlgL [Pseudorhodobacter sp. E13]|uniref:flagellin n=1 Tax=Pseudorhodobacter sp. E13 TaxID=2487931 RepID=UPI000F8EAE11|nr:flagellin [Pseudorhodobacter sp. E13]RUS61024.1 flagellar biosynthesis protein FlgL [Pseudorhodobacter sp. E13]
MGLVSLGDMAQSFMLRRMTTSLKQDSQVAAKELTTGRSADTSRTLRGDYSQLSGLQASLARLTGYQSATSSAALTSSTMQATLRTISDLTEGMGVNLLNAGTLTDGGTSSAFLQDVTERFDAVISSLNTKVGDKSLFAGIASDQPALVSSDVILSALEAEITSAGATTAQDIESVVSNWFAASSGFASVAYLGGAAASPLAISPDDKVELAITAADPALRDGLKALSLAALAARGTVTADATTKTELSRLAGASLLQNESDRMLLAGRLGLAEARIDQAQTRNQSEISALQMARSDMVAVDPYEAATRMEAAQNQLETLYSVTARLSRLRLVDFLR